MHIFVGIMGVLLIAAILWETFEATILPRRVTRRSSFTRIFYQTSWDTIALMARQIRPGKARERFLGVFGPISLILLLVIWAVSLVFGFACLHWADGSKHNVPNATFWTDVYLSGVTFFTLGTGDVVPASTFGRTAMVVEAGMGLGFLAIVIGYLPVIYQAFSRRELNISLLDARAGSPPTATELIRRHGEAESLPELVAFLRDWESWAADLLESHLSYPAIAYYRSQHSNQSWLAALATILDTCALVMIGVDGIPTWQARLTFAMTRHAVVDLAQVFNTPPSTETDGRLCESDLVRIRETFSTVGLSLDNGNDAFERLAKLRKMYEPYLLSMADRFLMHIPPFIEPVRAVDNWQTSAWESNPVAFASSPAPLRGLETDRGVFKD
jgi:hypothetical protein